MGLILDTSAIVAWERAQDADQVIFLDGNEELVIRRWSGPRPWQVLGWRIRRYGQLVEWRVWKRCAD